MTGIVMEIKDNTAVVYLESGKMKKIRDKNYRVGQRVAVKGESAARFVSLAACFVLVFMCGLFGNGVLRETAVSYIYLDINPSIRLDINRLGGVISVNALNDDAAELLSNHPVSESNPEKCIELIVEACRADEYITGSDTGVEIDVATTSDSLRSRVQKTSDSLKSLSVTVSDVEEEENSRAVSLSVSPRRLHVIEAYTEKFGGTVNKNAEKLKGVSNDEIYKMIYSEDSSIESGESETQRSTEKTEKKTATKKSSSEKYSASENSSSEKKTSSEEKIRSEEKLDSDREKYNRADESARAEREAPSESEHERHKKEEKHKDRDSRYEDYPEEEPEESYSPKRFESAKKH